MSCFAGLHVFGFLVHDLKYSPCHAVALARFRACISLENFRARDAVFLMIGILYSCLACFSLLS